MPTLRTHLFTIVPSTFSRTHCSTLLRAPMQPYLNSRIIPLSVHCSFLKQLELNEFLAVLVVRLVIVSVHHTFNKCLVNLNCLTTHCIPFERGERAGAQRPPKRSQGADGARGVPNEPMELPNEPREHSNEPGEHPAKKPLRMLFGVSCCCHYRLVRVVVNILLIAFHRRNQTQLAHAHSTQILPTPLRVLTGRSWDLPGVTHHHPYTPPTLYPTPHSEVCGWSLTGNF
jgi:hypothetical protein